MRSRLAKKSAGAVCAALLVCVSAAATASADTLYASTGAGGGVSCPTTLSSLYTLDPATGDATLVGPIDVGGNQVRHVTALAFDPTDGNLYGMMGGQESDCSDANTATLLDIDPATGDATIIGTQGEFPGHVPDMTIDPFGTLYAWSEPGDDDLYTVNKTNGDATLVGECGCSTAATGLASDSQGALFMKDSGVLHRMSPFTGAITSDVFLDQSPNNLLAFDSGDNLYTGTRTGPTGLQLQTIDQTTGTVTDVGDPNGVNNIGAITFDRGLLTEPDTIDLSMQKQVDDPTPAIGTNVVFTLTVSNDDADTAATGVIVNDVLPSGYTYVSDDGGGDYDDGTGEWSPGGGTVAASGSEVLNITATVTNAGGYDNVAEVGAANEYDTDSVPGGGGSAEDDYASASTDPFDPTRDAKTSIVVKGNTRAAARSKGFNVLITNDGTSSFFASTSQLDVTVNSQNVVTCKPASKTLAPGASLKATCDANIQALGLSPGNSVTYEATVDLPFDSDSGNDTSQFVTTAR